MRRPSGTLVFTLLVLGFFFRDAQASELSVDRRTIRLTETVTITVTLDGAFAGADVGSLPLQNLAIESGPSTESEISFIDGTLRRRKVFRYVARPLAPGAALVGPLVIEGEGGQRDTLAPVAVQVVADEAAGSNDPLTILRELVATGRDPLFVIVEVEKPRAWVGEEVVVTWVLYNASVVREWRISNVPKLPDFWSEELDVRGEQPLQTVVGTTVLQRLPIRRAALYPLRSGKLTIGSLEVHAEVMRRIDSGPFGIFEGSLVGVRYPSAPVTVDVRPLPDGQDVDVIGDVSLECAPPVQRGGGPVTIDVALRGRGNLRAARPPGFDGAVDGAVQIEERGVTVTRTRETATMTRRWTYSVFPAKEGRLDLPAVVARAFSPSRGTSEELRCEAATLEVVRAPESSMSPPARPGSAAARRSPRWRWMAGAAGAMLLVIVAWRRATVALRLRREVRALSMQATLAEVAAAVDAMLVARGLDPHALIGEPSERGDSYRAVRSLLDALDRERKTPAAARREIESRLRDLVQSLR
ncbi:MAG TPA: BatD family protein [Thermoanaerobaculia bacterium]|nr:BatD family protein [Thermoanaerobaculia bacterium]